jgi:hypothetical protein
MLAQFPKCGFCHSIAHDLNGFKVTTPPAPAAVTTPAPVKKQPKKK